MLVTKAAKAPAVAKKPKPPAAKPMPQPTAELDWPQVISHLGKANKVLSNILKNTEAKLVDGRLVITTSNKFYRQQLSSDKTKNEITTAVEQLCGVTPELDFVSGEQTTATQNTAALGRVADIMGGGEIINANQN
jgi:chromosomal replication initiation ATPase DnaA